MRIQRIYFLFKYRHKKGKFIVKHILANCILILIRSELDMTSVLGYIHSPSEDGGSGESLSAMDSSPISPTVSLVGHE